MLMQILETLEIPERILNPMISKVRKTLENFPIASGLHHLK